MDLVQLADGCCCYKPAGTCDAATGTIKLTTAWLQSSAVTSISVAAATDPD